MPSIEPKGMFPETIEKANNMVEPISAATGGLTALTGLMSMISGKGGQKQPAAQMSQVAQPPQAPPPMPAAPMPNTPTPANMNATIMPTRPIQQPIPIEGQMPSLANFLQTV